MSTTGLKRNARLDVPVSLRLKLSAFWGTLMFLYVYGDLFGFFRQDVISDISSGHGGFISSQIGLLVSAVVVAIPSLMIVSTLMLAVDLCRLLNIILGIAYTVVIIATMPGSWFYYLFLGVIEALLSLSIVWFAWRWPNASLTDN